MTAVQSNAFRVVGISFHEEARQRWIQWLPETLDIAMAQGGELPAAVLIREPANQYDRNAIGVHLPQLGADGQVGHVPRKLAEWLAPQMDRGMRVQAWVAGLAVHPDHPENPGLDIGYALHDPA